MVVKTNASFDTRYDGKITSNGQYYFVMKAANEEIIGVSEMYTTEAARDNGIEVVKRDAPNAPLENLN